MFSSLALGLLIQTPVVHTVIPYVDQENDFKISIEVPYAIGKWKLNPYEKPYNELAPIFPITYLRSDVPYEKNGLARIDLFLNQPGPGSETFNLNIFMDTDQDFEFKSKWSSHGWNIRLGFFITKDRKRSIGWFLAQGKYVDVRGFSFFSGENDKAMAQELTEAFKKIALDVLPKFDVKQDNWKKYVPHVTVIGLN